MISKMAILTDVTRCIGCEECVTACKKTYGLAADRPWRWQKDLTDLSATRWTTLINRPGGRHVRKQCRHCAEPACVSVCPVAALTKTPEGAVVYDGSKCMGCRYCMMACPYGIPRYTWNEPVPYVRKCVLCYHKIKSGEQEQPACTAACPVDATVYGEREALLEEAHRRLEAEPDRYINRVWGEKEVGGTNVLYLSDVDLGFLSWNPDLGEASLPSTTWPALRIVPGVFLGVGALMTGACWIIQRRMKLMNGGGGESSPVAGAVPPEAGADKACANEAGAADADADKEGSEETKEEADAK